MFQKLSTITVAAHIIWLTNLTCVCVHGQQSDGSVVLNQGVALGVNAQNHIQLCSCDIDIGANSIHCHSICE